MKKSIKNIDKSTVNKIIDTWNDHKNRLQNTELIPAGIGISMFLFSNTLPLPRHFRHGVLMIVPWP